METPAQYGHDPATIRAECLLPYAEGWQQPNEEEIRAVIKQSGMTGSEVARYVGIAEGRTVRRWTGGESDIPYAVWALLCDKAGYGQIWRPSPAKPAVRPALKPNVEGRVMDSPRLDGPRFDEPRSDRPRR